MDQVSILMPAYKAEAFIARAVKSVLTQSYRAFELLIISDDGHDYAPLLAQQGLADPRIRFLSTEHNGAGCAHGRNVGLQHARGEIIALLDADDEFHPDKLQRCAPLAMQHGLASCALEIRNKEGNLLRHVGTGSTEGLISPAQYKRTNISGDSIVLFNRRMVPAFFDEAIGCCEDVEFMLQCFQHVGAIYHCPIPLHFYYKQPGSMSNAPLTHIRFTQSKNMLIQRLTDDHYHFADTGTCDAMLEFLTLSLKAESLFEEALKHTPRTLFEDVIEGLF